MTSDVHRRLQFRRRSVALRAARAGPGRRVACACTDVAASTWSGGWRTPSQLGVHTTVLVQGDTLGGGLESVMSFHKVIFEHSAQAGFPGGAVQPVSGHGGVELHDPQGRLRDRERDDSLRQALYRRATPPSHLVDMVVDDGAGEAAIEHRASLGRIRRLRGTLAALEGAALRVADHVRVDDDDRRPLGRRPRLKLTDRDLRLMERLARAQARKAGGACRRRRRRDQADRARSPPGTRSEPASPSGRLGLGGSSRRRSLRQPGLAYQVAKLLARVGLGQVAVHAGLREHRAASSSNASAVKARIGTRRPTALRASRRRISRVAVVAVHDRHLAVHQDHDRRAGAREVERLVPSIASTTSSPERLEHLARDHAIDVVVFDDEYRPEQRPRRRRGRPSRNRSCDRVRRRSSISKRRA